MKVINYEKLLTTFSNVFKYKVEITLLERPKNAEYWALNPNGNTVYQVYTTSWKKDSPCSFGFWKYDEDLNEACKKAFTHLIPSLKWEYKTRLKK
jgi:hypothetical protein